MEAVLFMEKRSGYDRRINARAWLGRRVDDDSGLQCYYKIRLELGVIMKYPFTSEVKRKGWKMKDLAWYWGVTPRRLSQIAANPGQLHIDALKGLPDFEPHLLNYRIENT
jgi:hypothetical protein